MSSRGISITIGGGNAQFGNVSEGDGSSLRADLSQNVAGAFADLDRELVQAAISGQAGDEAVDALRKEVAALQSAIAEGRTSGSSIGQTAKRLYQNYGWAIEPLRKLFLFLAP